MSYGFSIIGNSCYSAGVSFVSSHFPSLLKPSIVIEPITAIFFGAMDGVISTLFHHIFTGYHANSLFKAVFKIAISFSAAFFITNYFGFSISFLHTSILFTISYCIERIFEQVILNDIHLALIR